MRKRVFSIILVIVLSALSACRDAHTEETVKTEDLSMAESAAAQYSNEEADEDYVQLMFDWSDETKVFQVDLNEDGEDEFIKLEIGGAYQYAVSVNDNKYIIGRDATYFSEAFLVKKAGNYYIYMQLKGNALPDIRDIVIFRIENGLVCYAGSFEGQLMQFDDPDGFIIRRFGLEDRDLWEAECFVDHDGMPVVIDEKYEQIPDDTDLYLEDLSGETVEEYWQEKLGQIPVCELTGEILQCNVRREKITNQWLEQGEVEFVVAITSEQFTYNDYELSVDVYENNIKQAIGKEVGEEFVHFYDGSYHRYSILEIKKNEDLGNKKEAVEYGDTIRASYCKAKAIESYSEFAGSFWLQIDQGRATFLESDFTFGNLVVQKIENEARTMPLISGEYDMRHVWWAGFDVYDEEYKYSISATAFVNEETKPQFTIPEDWGYQFGVPKIGSFKDYDWDVSASAFDMEGGRYFGYEDRLSDGCSTWCACCSCYCEATASSSLAPQGNNTYGVENLNDECRMATWSEGVPGDGIGESIEIREMYQGGSDGELFRYNEVCIVNGYAKSEKAWQENNRVKSMKLYFMDEYMGTITLEDTMLPQYIDLSPVAMKVGNGCEAKFRFEITEVYKGTKYDDTCISGIVVEFEGRQAH